MGKLSTRELEKLLACIKKDPRVIVPPSPGYDSGVHLIDDRYMVVSTDPCIGVPKEWFGWLLIHYAASDVALFGTKPQYCTINLLGTPSTRSEIFYRIMTQACKAADELEMAVVTGHTGTYDGLSTLAGVCTAYGTVDKDKLVTPGGAKVGDCIICTKNVGLEIAVNLALTNGVLAKKLFGPQRTLELSRLVEQQSCVKEALTLARVGAAHAMHDATECGIVAALNEMAEASKVGFEIEWERIQIAKEAYILQKHFKLSNEQVLSMSSTGTILAAVPPKAVNKVERVLRRNNIVTSVLGVFTEDKRRILSKNMKRIEFPKKADDPYGTILSEKL